MQRIEGTPGMEMFPLLQVSLASRWFPARSYLNSVIPHSGTTEEPPLETKDWDGSGHLSSSQERLPVSGDEEVLPRRGEGGLSSTLVLAMMAL